MISVIVPAYNAAERLAACLAALKDQTLAPDEIIVVNDGSNDATSAVARANGVQVLEQIHQGPAAARNHGIRQAQGEFVLFTDADCVPASTWVAEMVRPLANPEVAGVKGSYTTLQHQPVARLVQCEFEERYDLQERKAFIDFIDSYAAAFRVDVLRDLGGFDPAFPQANNEDVELSYRLDRAGCRLVFNRSAIVSHHHPSSWSAYLRTKIKRGYWRMLVYRLFPGKALRDTYTPQMLKLQISLMVLALLFAVLALFMPQLGWGTVAALIGLLLSAIPFARRASQKDKSLRFSAVAFITLRALAITIGMTGGLAAMFFFRPSSPEAKKEAVRPHA